MSKCEECELSDIPEEIRKNTMKCNICKLNSAFRGLFEDIIDIVRGKEL